jgi:large subunit ribosomal protein L31
MKSDIHPIWHDDCKVTCSCGATFLTGSTNDTLKVDICSKCHPFFTGEMRFVDEQGRVEKFQLRQKHAANWQATKKEKVKTAQAKAQAPKSLKEMLSGAKPESNV